MLSNTIQITGEVRIHRHWMHIQVLCSLFDLDFNASITRCAFEISYLLLRAADSISIVTGSLVILLHLIFYFPKGLSLEKSRRWYYAKDIDPNEAYAFVCYESRTDRARFTPHTGFKDLSVGPDAPPRESIEIRAFCFWEDGTAN